jgi:hypothetical protein
MVKTASLALGEIPSVPEKGRPRKGPPDISATVSNNTGPVPTGTVTFSMEPAAIPESSKIPLQNGAASWPLVEGMGGPLIAVGAYTVNADYNGDDNYDEADGSSTFAIGKADSKATFSSCPSSVPAGQPSFTVGVAWFNDPTATGAAEPTGQVSLVALPYSGSAINSKPVDLVPFPLGASTATIPIPLPAGSYTITATYQGDDNYNTATSAQCAVTAH